MTCPFCNPRPEDIVHKNDHCYAVWERSPKSKGHMVVIPYRHVPGYYSLTDDERRSLMNLVNSCRGLIRQKFSPVDCYIGFTAGHNEGLMVLHLHCHVIPHYDADVPETVCCLNGVAPVKQAD
jgi:diadenosine tetraphosphate (Ap4A) HIT family hydrolase